MEMTELLVHSSKTETKSSWEVKEKYYREREDNTWRNGYMRNFHLIFNETTIGECFDNFLFV